MNCMKYDFLLGFYANIFEFHMVKIFNSEVCHAMCGLLLILCFWVGCVFENRLVRKQKDFLIGL